MKLTDFGFAKVIEPKAESVNFLPQEHICHMRSGPFMFIHFQFFQICPNLRGFLTLSKTRTYRERGSPAFFGRQSYFVV